MQSPIKPVNWSAGLTEKRLEDVILFEFMNLVFSHRRSHWGLSHVLPANSVPCSSCDVCPVFFLRGLSHVLPANSVPCSSCDACPMFFLRYLSHVLPARYVQCCSCPCRGVSGACSSSLQEWPQREFEKTRNVQFKTSVLHTDSQTIDTQVECDTMSQRWMEKTSQWRYKNKWNRFVNDIT